MSESLNQWVSRLSYKPLPVMLRTLTQVRDLLGRSSASHTALCEVIEHDPGYTLHIFQRLNTLPHPPKEPITKIANALPLMGMGLIEQAAQSLPALEDKLKGPPRRGLIDCYSRAAHAAIYAENLAERKRYREPKSLAGAALLYDIGEMALWSEAPDSMRRIRQLDEQGSGREAAALQVLGFTIEELNQHLSRKWRLPELTQLSQSPYNSYQPQPLTVMLASAIARTSASPRQSRANQDNLELLAEFLGISHAKAQAEFHRLAAAAARELQILPIPLPAFSLIQTPQAAVAKPPRRAESKPEPAPQAAGGENQSTQASAATPQSKPLAAGTDRPAPASNPLHENLSRTLDQMKEEHDLHNLMFAMLSPDKKQLKARLVIEQEATTRLKDLSINLQEPSLFTALMKKPQALWLNPGNLEKYLPLIPESINHSLCGRGFLVMSIFVRNRPIGLFYADNGCDKQDLSPDQYNQFKTLCQDFMKTLS